MLLILLLLTFSGISQTAYDSTKLPNSQLKKAINIIEEGKVVKRELALEKQKTLLLDSIIRSKDSSIAAYKRLDTTNNRMIQGYKDAGKNLQMTIANLEFKNTLQGGMYDAEKKKKWWALAFGIAVGILISR